MEQFFCEAKQLANYFFRSFKTFMVDFRRNRVLCILDVSVCLYSSVKGKCAYTSIFVFTKCFGNLEPTYIYTSWIENVITYDQDAGVMSVILRWDKILVLERLRLGFPCIIDRVIGGSNSNSD